VDVAWRLDEIMLERIDHQLGLLLIWQACHW